MFRMIFFLEQHLLLPKNNPLIKENYDKILNNYKQLTLELKITDPFQLTYFLATLLGNGYLSYNKINNNSNPRIKELGSAIHVIRGNGVCRDYAIFLRDYLLKFNIKSIQLVGNLEKSTLKNLEKSNPFNLLIESLYVEILKRQDDNHVINLIQKDNHFFAYDITNCMCLYRKDINRFYSTDNINLFVPDFHFSNEFNLYSPNNELLLDVADSSLNNILSFNKEEHIAFINNICDENFRLIYDAYINIQKELNIIKEESDRLILTRKK